MILGEKKLKSRLLVVLLSTALLNLAACGKKDTVPAADGEMVVKIGAIQPLTGPQSHLGKDNENGTRMAIDDANAKGISIGGKKVRFELLSEDDQADPKTATIVAQKMVDEKVNGIIGHLNSGTTIPTSKIYSDAGIVQISPSATNPKYTEQGFRTAFRVMPNDVQQGKALGEITLPTLTGLSMGWFVLLFIAILAIAAWGMRAAEKRFAGLRPE